MTGAKILLGAALAAGVAALALPDLGPDAGPTGTRSPGPGPAVLFASLPRGSDPLEGGRLPAGSRLLRGGLDGAASPRPLVEGFTAAGDPHVSFDGETVLFAGRRGEGDRDGVWEVRPDGSGLRRLAGVEGGDCRHPVRLPDGRVAFSAPAAGFGAPGGGVRALFTVNGDGSGLQRITFHADGEDGEPLVVNDGRIVYVHRDREGSTLLWVHVDGTFPHPLHGQRLPPAVRERPREAADRTLYFLERPSGGGEPAARRLDPRRPERPAVDALPGLEGAVAAVEPLPGGGLLVSHRPAAGRPTYGLLLFPAGGAAEGRVLFDDPDREEADPAVLAPRRRPQGHIATVDPKKGRGELFCIDARRLDSPTSLRGLPAAAAVRFYAAPDAGGPEAEGGSLLGTVPLDPDGSFYVALPPDRPLRVVALAGDGSVVADSGPSFWVRPGEVRGCIGCHEDPSVSPPNVFPKAVERDPVDLGAGGGR